MPHSSIWNPSTHEEWRRVTVHRRQSSNIQKEVFRNGYADAQFLHHNWRCSFSLFFAIAFLKQCISWQVSEKNFIQIFSNASKCRHPVPIITINITRAILFYIYSYLLPLLSALRYFEANFRHQSFHSSKNIVLCVSKIKQIKIKYNIIPLSHIK